MRKVDWCGGGWFGVGVSFLWRKLVFYSIFCIFEIGFCGGVFEEYLVFGRDVFGDLEFIFIF